MLGVEKQNAVFCNDADDHDHAHEGSDVKRRASDEKGEQAAERGEQRGSEDGGWRGKRAKFEQEHGEQQNQRKDKNHKQVAEGFHLFGVGAAIFHADGGRQVQIVDSFFDGGDAGTKVHTFEAAGDFHEPLKILAADFGLPRV